MTLRFWSWWYLLRPYWNKTFPCTDLSEASGVGRPFMIQSRDQPCKKPSPGFVWWTKVTQRKAVYYYWTRLASRALHFCNSYLPIALRYKPKTFCHMYGDKEIQTVESLIVAVSQIHLGLPLWLTTIVCIHISFLKILKKKKNHTHTVTLNKLVNIS